MNWIEKKRQTNNNTYTQTHIQKRYTQIFIEPAVIIYLRHYYHVNDYCATMCVRFCVLWIVFLQNASKQTNYNTRWYTKVKKKKKQYTHTHKQKQKKELVEHSIWAAVEKQKQKQNKFKKHIQHETKNKTKQKHSSSSKLKNKQKQKQIKYEEKHRQLFTNTC